MSSVKDYYQILEVKPSACLADIKKAYRRLALRYHPDKNNNDPFAAAKFAEAKEAYEVLTKNIRKEYYLRQRGYNQSMSNENKQIITTPVTVLKQVLELEKYVSTLDVFRMDKAGLKDYILELFSDSTIETLKTFREPEIICEIVARVVKTIHPLPKTYTSEIVNRLTKLARGNKEALHQINAFIKESEWRDTINKYTIPSVIVITLVLCLLIRLAAR